MIIQVTSKSNPLTQCQLKFPIKKVACLSFHECTAWLIKDIFYVNVWEILKEIKRMIREKNRVLREKVEKGRGEMNKVDTLNCRNAMLQNSYYY